jgi:hypothetical protein
MAESTGGALTDTPKDRGTTSRRTENIGLRDGQILLEYFLLRGCCRYPHMENNVIMVEAVAKMDMNREYGKPPGKTISAWRER